MIGQGPGARSVKLPVAAVHAGRRDDADRAADLAAARALRHRPPARLLHRRRPRARSCGARRGSSACRSTPRRRPRSPGARAARRASPTACCGGCATTPRCAPTASITADVARRALEPARGGRARLRRDRSPAAADDHREVRRRPGRRRQPRCGDQRGARRDRGHLRTVPHPARVPGSHAARPRRHGARVRVFGLAAPGRDRLW